MDSETKKSAFLSDNNLDELRALAVSPQRSKDEALSIAQQMTRSTTRSALMHSEKEKYYQYQLNNMLHIHP